MIRRSASALLVSALLALLALSTAGPASAHAIRLSADPAPDSSVSAGPPRVSATFNERLQPDFATMAVVGPDGNVWSTGQAQIQGAVASIELRQPLGPTGDYAVNYRVTSADGHVVTGEWAFKLTTAGNGTPGPPVAAPADDGVPVWPFVALAAVIVGAGAVMAVRRRG